jgi:hypothetical protein
MVLKTSKQLKNTTIKDSRNFIIKKVIAFGADADMRFENLCGYDEKQPDFPYKCTC